MGYRSLRGSHSISDLSLAGNLDGSRSALSSTNRYAKTGKFFFIKFLEKFCLLLLLAVEGLTLMLTYFR